MGIKLKELQDRKPLGEGRSYQMGFAYCKKVEDDSYETIQAITACKDYLNDTIFSEVTGKNCSAYSFTSKYTGVFKDAKKAYLVFKIVPNKYDLSKYTFTGISFDADVVNLEANYKNVQKIINAVETAFGLNELTEIEKVSEFHPFHSTAPDSGTYLATAPLFWVKQGYLTSLYTLLIRVAQFWNGEGDPLTYLWEGYTQNLDKSLWEGERGGKKILKWLIEHGPIEIPYTRPELACAGTAVHNAGVLSLANYLKDINATALYACAATNPYIITPLKINE